MNEDPAIGPIVAKNVSPNYGQYDRKSSQQAIEERRERRRSGGADPVAQLTTKIETLRRNQENDQKKIADLEEFRRGMTGDESIKVADNRITWVGRAGEQRAGSNVIAAVIRNGQAGSIQLLSDGDFTPFA